MYNMGLNAAQTWDYTFPFLVTFLLTVVGFVLYFVFFKNVEFNRSKFDKSDRAAWLEEQEDSGSGLADAAKEGKTAS